MHNICALILFTCVYKDQSVINKNYIFLRSSIALQCSLSKLRSACDLWLKGSVFFFKSLLSWKMCSPIKGFLLIVPLKASRDQWNFRFWLLGVQFNSTLWCTPQSLTLGCDAHHVAWHCGQMHTAELDSTVGCTPQSFLRNLVHLILRCDAHLKTWFLRGKQTVELDSSVGCTLWIQTYLKMFHVFIFFTSFDFVFSKNFWSKKDSLNNLWIHQQ